MSARSVFDRSRRRIVAAIMAVLTVLFAATLAAIYAFSYAEVYDRNAGMLQDYAATYQADRLPAGMARPNGALPPQPEKELRAAPFCAVLFDKAGEAVAVENANAEGCSDEELVQLAETAQASGQRSGLEGGFLFAVERAPGYTLVAFMDNALVAESMGTLFHYTLIVGLAALVALFFVARWLAERIVAPMQRAYEAQRRFIADAGHELKTPVAVVEANAELLQREAGESRWLANIRYENGRMGALVGQMLELARAEQGGVRHVSLDLSRMVEAEALSFESVAFERGMPFTCDVAEDIEVKGDASELARLVAILLDNAFSHGLPGTEVRLVLARAGAAVRLAVSNGIAPESAEALRGSGLFERFARGDEARSHNGDDAQAGHYGLGLAIARAIALAHDGSIRASVDQAGSVVTFEVSLPVKKR